MESRQNWGSVTGTLCLEGRDLTNCTNHAVLKLVVFFAENQFWWLKFINFLFWIFHSTDLYSINSIIHWILDLYEFESKANKNLYQNKIFIGIENRIKLILKWLEWEQNFVSVPCKKDTDEYRYMGMEWIRPVMTVIIGERAEAIPFCL